MHRLNSWLLAASLAATSTQAEAAPVLFAETQTLRISDPGPGDDLGYSLGTGGGMLIAGAINVKDHQGRSVGAAYVYSPDATGQWIETAVLRPDDGQHNDAFGMTSDIYGLTAVVGVPWNNALGDSSGAAYVFASDDPRGWQQRVKLVAPDGKRNEYFGGAVAISGSVIAVGANLHQDSPAPGVPKPKGAVYLYANDAQRDWSFTQKLQPQDVGYGDGFGRALDIYGDTLVATSHRTDPRFAWQSGAAYIFKKGAEAWTQVAKLVPDDPLGGGAFATDVSLNEGRLLVGTLPLGRDDIRGTAYIYEEDSTGQWIQTARLVPHDIDQRWFFGSEVTLFGDYAAVTAYSSPHGPLDPVTYLFQRDSIGAWTEIATLTSAAAGSSFGYTLAAADGQLFVSSGINAPGAVHVFSQVPEPAGLLLALSGLACTAMRRAPRSRPA